MINDETAKDFKEWFAANPLKGASAHAKVVQESFASILKEQSKRQQSKFGYGADAGYMANNPMAYQMQMMNMMYMGMMQPYQQMMMMNMMQGMNLPADQTGAQGGFNRGLKNQFVRRAKDRDRSTEGPDGQKKRGPNKRRGGYPYDQKSGFNDSGYGREDKNAPKKPRVRLDSDNFPSLASKVIVAGGANENASSADPKSSDHKVQIADTANMSGKLLLIKLIVRLRRGNCSGKGQVLRGHHPDLLQEQPRRHQEAGVAQQVHGRGGSDP